MKITYLRRIIGPVGIILLCFIIILLWFKKGLLFSGAEDELFFYNYTRSLELFSHIWYQAGIGYPTLSYLPRITYFLVFESLYRLGISNVLMEAITFLILMLTGTLSVFFLLRETIGNDIKDDKKLVPFLGSIFYLLNPFSTTQIWGRGLTYQIFAFALVPVFLLFFILSIQRKNLFFCVITALFSVFLSTSYTSPAVVLTSWVNIAIYLIFYLFSNKNNYKKNLFALFSFLCLFTLWMLLNSFWIYPLIKHGSEMLSANLTVRDNIDILKALSPQQSLDKVIRLIHREYYDGTYGETYNSFIFVIISWLLPIIVLFSIPALKKTYHLLFFVTLFVVSVFVCIGTNFPTGWLLIWLFERVPLLQVLRNPYEKFGINLVLAYSPFFAVGLIVFSEKLARLYKSQKLKYFFVSLFTFLICGILVWPIWKGNFAGGIRGNFWIEIPKYYNDANIWLNKQDRDFNILHLPLLPEDGVTYTWEHPYEGIEPSEFIFDKGSIARNFGVNKNYYSVLLNKLGANVNYKGLPYWSNNFEDFNEDKLYEELAKLNIRFIVLHFDTDYKKRRSVNPEETKKYLESQDNIKKINEFEKLEIYKVEIPSNIDLIYSPNLKIDYKKVDTSNYLVDVKNANGEIDLYFLQHFHPSWEASINGEKMENHIEVFSYANLWKINKQGDYQIAIKFVQQESVNLGTKVTFLTLGVLMIIILFYLVKMRKIFL